MINQKQVLIVIFLACVMLPSCFLTRKSDAFNDEIGVTTAASEGLEHYLNLIPEGQEELFGFENREDFSSAKTGRAYQLYALTPEFYATGQLNHGNYIMPLNEWLVSVETGGEANALLTVSMKDNEWQTVGIGAAKLVKELSHFNKHLVQEEGIAKLLRVPQLACDLLIIRHSKQPGTERVYLLESARVALEAQIEPGQSFSLHEALVMVKQKVKNTVQP